MGVPVIVYGKSGSGKSFSLKSFGPGDIMLCNCMGKPLPFRGRFTYTCKVLSPATILEAITKAYKDHSVRSAVIDDAGYIMTQMFMNGHRDKHGANQFDLYNDIGDVFWQMMCSVMAMPDDVIVYFMMHETTNDSGECKIRTIGRLLDDKVCLEGLCTIVLHTVSDAIGHRFRVQAGSNDIAKSPDGMFSADEISNDLKVVDDAIRAYYEMSGNAAN